MLDGMQGWDVTLSVFCLRSFLRSQDLHGYTGKTRSQVMVTLLGKSSAREGWELSAKLWWLQSPVFQADPVGGIPCVWKWLLLLTGAVLLAMHSDFLLSASHPPPSLIPAS